MCAQTKAGDSDSQPVCRCTTRRAKGNVRARAARSCSRRSRCRGRGATALAAAQYSVEARLIPGKCHARASPTFQSCRASWRSAAGCWQAYRGLAMRRSVGPASRRRRHRLAAAVEVPTRAHHASRRVTKPAARARKPACSAEGVDVRGRRLRLGTAAAAGGGGRRRLRQRRLGIQRRASASESRLYSIFSQGGEKQVEAQARRCCIRRRQCGGRRLRAVG
jgi:hypothetical protein